MTKSEAKSVLAVLALLKQIEKKIKADKPKSKPGEFPKSVPGEWELVMANAFLHRLLGKKSRDLYVKDIDVIGWSISWKPTSVNEQLKYWEDVISEEWFDDFADDDQQSILDIRYT